MSGYGTSLFLHLVGAILLFSAAVLTHFVGAKLRKATTVQEVRPERCACGNRALALTTPYHTHQVIELPLIAMDVTRWVLHQGWGPDCGCWSKAEVPTKPTTGYGSRFSHECDTFTEEMSYVDARTARTDEDSG